MSFDWTALLTLAEYMNKNASEFPDEEACYRTVISRAYYATYCLSRNFCKAVDGFTSYGDDHKKLQNHLLTHPDKKRRRLGNRLNMLHEDRKTADYDNDLGELPRNKASKALKQARTIVESLKQLSS
jgi:uncharacterized protein (UPF0332 family)